MDFRGNFPEGPAHWSVWLQEKWEAWTRRNRDTKNFVREVNVWWQLARSMAGIPRSLLFQGKLSQALTVLQQSCLVQALLGSNTFLQPVLTLTHNFNWRSKQHLWSQLWFLRSINHSQELSWVIVEAINLTCLKNPKNPNKTNFLQILLTNLWLLSEERHTLTF